MAQEYVKKHDLYIEALQLWKSDQDAYELFQDIYGDHLFDRRDFIPAALAYQAARKFRKAMGAFEKAHAWQDLFALAATEGMDEESLRRLSSRISKDLISRQRYIEAARVLFDYGGELSDAVSALIRGNEVSEALRIVALRKQPDLIELIIKPLSLELCESINEDIREVQEQLQKQSARLVELRKKRDEEPDAFYMTEDDPNLHNVEIMTEAGESVAGTAFTRYTIAPSALSKRSKQTNKSKKKQARKQGRKGTVDEEEYILQSFVKLVARLEVFRGDAARLLRHLVLFSKDHREAGKVLQNTLQSFEQGLRDTIELAWPPLSAEDREKEEIHREVEARENRSANLKVGKPVFADGIWVVRLINL
jgi:elongator complex protein 1